MKIEITCRCGARALWWDENSALVRRCAREFEERHEKCMGSFEGSTLNAEHRTEERVVASSNSPTEAGLQMMAEAGL